MSAPILDLAGLVVRFGGLTAVDGLSFQVQRGTIHALIGPNGAGKSTTFNCISRYYQPSGGRILLEGKDIARKRAQDMASLGVARTFQNLELFAELSVLDNVMLGAYTLSAGRWPDRLRRVDGETRDRVGQLMENLGLIPYRNMLAGHLDFGHQKLLELARALAGQPRLLMLDEPAAGLRNREVESLDRLLRELVERDGLTVLLVEHVMQLVMSVSDRITVMSFGRKIAEGRPEEVRDDPQVIEAYLGKGQASS